MAYCDFCIRYFLLLCFILLGVSGIVVCTASGYFVYQFSESGYPDVDNIDNAESPSVVLLCTGLLTFAVSIYFWIFVDEKYNFRQYILFSVILAIIVSVEVGSGIWALSKFEYLEVIMSTSLKKSLELPKINNISIAISHAEMKDNCCGYDETQEDDIRAWPCCDFERLNNSTRFDCQSYYGVECGHLAINRFRIILHRVFLLSLSSVFFQLFILLVISSYFRSKKRQRKRSRRFLRRKSIVI